MAQTSTSKETLSKAILDVIREVKYGISAEHIYANVKKLDDFKFKEITIEEIKTGIRAENDLGTIRERLNGLYCMTCRQAKRRKFDGFYLSDDEENIEVAKLISMAVPNSSGKKKKGKQIKKVKITPTTPELPQVVPNENKVENIKKEPPTVCSYCGLDAIDAHTYLTCCSCFSRTHQKCLDYSDKLINRCRQYAWQCMNCKTCTICIDSGNPDNMLFCDSCDKGYHTSCHDPKITDTPQGAWVCSNCVKEDKKLVEFSAILDNVIPGPPSAEVKNNDFNDENQLPLTNLDGNNNKNDGSDESHEVSNIASWTAQEISEFFKSLGFTKEADVFENQEIDGRTLLLMRRNDVLTELSLKLGPALKIYKHVSHLQMGWSTQQCLDTLVKKQTLN